MAKAVKRKIAASKNGNGKLYLTKRVLQRAIMKGTQNISAKAMAARGYVLTARRGWVVKVYQDGRTEKIAPLSKVQRPKRIVLD